MGSSCFACSPDDKDATQAEEKDADNTFPEDNYQEVLVKETVGKPLNSIKLASNKMFIVSMDEEKFRAFNKTYSVSENCAI